MIPRVISGPFKAFNCSFHLQVIEPQKVEVQVHGAVCIYVLLFSIISRMPDYRTQGFASVRSWFLVCPVSLAILWQKMMPDSTIVLFPYSRSFNSLPSFLLFVFSIFFFLGLHMFGLSNLLRFSQTGWFPGFSWQR